MSLQQAIYGDVSSSRRACDVPGCDSVGTETLRYRFDDGIARPVHACPFHATEARKSGRVVDTPARAFHRLTTPGDPMPEHKPCKRPGCDYVGNTSRGYCPSDYGRGVRALGGKAKYDPAISDEDFAKAVASWKPARPPAPAPEVKPSADPLDTIAQAVGADPDGPEQEIVDAVRFLAEERSAVLAVLADPARRARAEGTFGVPIDPGNPPHIAGAVADLFGRAWRIYSSLRTLDSQHAALAGKVAALEAQVKYEQDRAELWRARFDRLAAGLWAAYRDAADDHSRDTELDGILAGVLYEFARLRASDNSVGSRLMFSQRAALDRARVPAVGEDGAEVSDGWRAKWAAEELVAVRGRRDAAVAEIDRLRTQLAEAQQRAAAVPPVHLDPDELRQRVSLLDEADALERQAQEKRAQALRVAA